MGTADGTRESHKLRCRIENLIVILSLNIFITQSSALMLRRRSV